MLGISPGGRFNYGTQLEPTLAAMKQAGVAGLRDHASWPQVEPTLGGGYNFAQTDRLFAAVEKHGLQLSYGLSNRDDRSYDWDHVTPYAACMAAMAERYEDHPMLVGWEPDNEPDHFRTDRDPIAARAFAFQRAFYSAVKPFARNVPVMTGGVGGMKADSGAGEGTAGTCAAWLEGMYQLGAKNYLDAVAFHAYTRPLTWRQSMQQDRRGAYLLHAMRRVMKSHGDGLKPIWVNEYGNATAGNDSALSEHDQAVWLADAVGHMRKLWWVGPIFIFNWQDNANVIDQGDCMGLLRADGTAKPALATFTDLARSA